MEPEGENPGSLVSHHTGHFSLDLRFAMGSSSVGNKIVALQYIEWNKNHATTHTLEKKLKK